MSRRRPVRSSRGLKKRLDTLGKGARNALELLGEGRLAAPARAPYAVVDEDDVHRLRRYGDAALQEPDGTRPLLLVPPLMVHSEVYDITPELSAVSWLISRGLDVWLIDFGAPEHQSGGMKRSLDDHVLAIDRAITSIADRCDGPVHLAGYSQGGMFCYEAAAFRQSRDIESLITFGAPVDLYRNLPVKVHDELAERLFHAAGQAMKLPLEGLDGVSAFLSSSSFKLLYPGNELKHFAKFMELLPDKQALVEEESKRRFLGGEGFVAWPGPALRDFVAQVVAENRLKSGGLVIDQKAVSLSDITCPLLYFFGTTDNLARPSAVKAIERVAPKAETCAVEIDAGHFGLVVGSRAMSTSWPLVEEWIRWQAHHRDEGVEAFHSTCVVVSRRPKKRRGTHTLSQALFRAATVTVDDMWQRLGEASLQGAEMIDAMRWQIPRMALLESMSPDTRVSPGLALAEQARAIPQAPFLLWRGRAYTYEEANRRVRRIAAVLHQWGVRPGQRVGLWMDDHPDCLTVLAAISRLAAVSVPLNAEWSQTLINDAIETAEIEYLVTDVTHSGRARVLATIKLAVLGLQHDPAPATFENVLDLDAGIASEPSLPDDLLRNPGLAKDTAMVFFASSPAGGGFPIALRVTNGRWALAALGAAAGCRLTPRDTLFCCLPLHTGLGTLVVSGGALVGGARLVLAPRVKGATFLDEVRRTGSTVIPYTSELVDRLLDTPPRAEDSKHPMRLFLGSGMDEKRWKNVQERFGSVQVLEFFAQPEANFVLANLTGEKPGSVGRPVVRERSVELVRFDPDTRSPVRNDRGRATGVGVDEPGVLIAKISKAHLLADFDGYLDETLIEERVLENVFRKGDRWFDSRTLFTRDQDGDHWLVR